MANIKAHRELVSIFQRGSWYKVCFLETNVQGGRRLRTFTVQGYTTPVNIASIIKLSILKVIRMQYH